MVSAHRTLSRPRRQCGRKRKRGIAVSQDGQISLMGNGVQAPLVQDNPVDSSQSSTSSRMTPDISSYSDRGEETLRSSFSHTSPGSSATSSGVFAQATSSALEAKPPTSTSPTSVETATGAAVTVESSSRVSASGFPSYVSENWSTSANEPPATTKDSPTAISSSYMESEPTPLSTTASYSETDLPLSTIQPSPSSQSISQSLPKISEGAFETSASQAALETLTASETSSTGTGAADVPDGPRISKTTSVTLGGIGGVAFLALALAYLLRVRRRRKKRQGGFIDLDSQLPWSNHGERDAFPGEMTETFNPRESLPYPPAASRGPYLSDPHPLQPQTVYNDPFGHHSRISTLSADMEPIPTPRSVGTLPENSVPSANSFGPLKVTNYGPGERSRVSSTVGLQVMFEPEYGTPRVGMTEARFMTVNGRGLEVPWMVTAHHPSALPEAQIAETGYWGAKRGSETVETFDSLPYPGEDKFTRLPERSFRQQGSKNL